MPPALRSAPRGVDAVQLGAAHHDRADLGREVLDELERWCTIRGVRTVEELVAAAHQQTRAQGGAVAPPISTGPIAPADPLPEQ